MASVKLYLRKKKLSNELCPITLRVTHLRKTNLISLNIKCRPEDWNEKREEFRKSMPNSKNQNMVLGSIKSKAEQIIQNYDFKEIDFDFNRFKNDLFHYKNKSSDSVFDFWRGHVTSLSDSKRIGSSQYYKNSMDSFLSFVGKESLKFKDITYNLLNDYENFLRRRDCIPNGIAVRMRAIRAIYNEAIKKGVANQNDYPFKKYKISKLKGTTDKRALTYDEIIMIKDLDLSEYPYLLNSRNYFIFSYYTRGMNFYDMLLLKWKDVYQDTIVYVRNKTKARFVIKRTKTIDEILAYYKKNALETEYVFPLLLHDNLTPTQIDNRKHKTLSKYNKDLKEIASLCGIDKKVTSYVARHSFATNLKHKGISTDIISEAMGHKNLSITQAYLKDFENTVIDDAVGILED